MKVVRRISAALLLSAIAAPATARAEDRPPDLFPAYRLGYAAGGALALTGLGFGLVARADAIKAGQSTSARETTALLTSARSNAATANLCYAAAGVTALYALVLEFLPRPAADASSLAFRF